MLDRCYGLPPKQASSHEGHGWLQDARTGLQALRLEAVAPPSSLQVSAACLHACACAHMRGCSKGPLRSARACGVQMEGFDMRIKSLVLKINEHRRRRAMLIHGLAATQVRRDGEWPHAGACFSA